jgi:type III restriction enzyme
VLLPTDPDNYYREPDVLPPDLPERLGQARILITNYHAFLPGELGDAARSTKAILAHGEAGVFTETPDQVVRRVCRDLGGKKQIVVINDEAHHCYRRRPEAEKETLSGEEHSEAEKRDKEARVWLSGSRRSRTRSASDRSTSCPPCHSSRKGPAIRRGRCFRGWCPTFRSSMPSKPASSQCRGFPSQTTR